MTLMRQERPERPTLMAEYRVEPRSRAQRRQVSESAARQVVSVPAESVLPVSGATAEAKPRIPERDSLVWERAAPRQAELELSVLRQVESELSEQQALQHAAQLSV
jgi:hypothetical protein